MFCKCLKEYWNAEIKTMYVKFFISKIRIWIETISDHILIPRTLVMPIPVSVTMCVYISPIHHYSTGYDVLWNTNKLRQSQKYSSGWWLEGMIYRDRNWGRCSLSFSLYGTCVLINLDVSVCVWWWWGTRKKTKTATPLVIGKLQAERASVLFPIMQGVLSLLAFSNERLVAFH